MNNEEKQIVLIDLCGRLPYGVKVVDDMGRVCTLTLGNVDLCSIFYGEDFDQGNTPSVCKPYLRPMSSMTEEEEKEFNDQIYKAKPYSDGKSYNVYEVTGLNIDWLNAYHFDFRGLIEKGLAIEAPEGMYNK